MLQQKIRVNGFGENLKWRLASVHQLCRLRVARKQNDPARRTLLHDHGRSFDAVQATEHHVEDCNVRQKSRHNRNCLFARVDCDRFVPLCLKDAGKSIGDAGLVVHDENSLNGVRHG